MKINDLNRQIYPYLKMDLPHKKKKTCNISLWLIYQFCKVLNLIIIVQILEYVSEFFFFLVKHK